MKFWLYSGVQIPTSGCKVLILVLCPDPLHKEDKTVLMMQSGFHAADAEHTTNFRSAIPCSKKKRKVFDFQFYGCNFLKVIIISTHQN